MISMKVMYCMGFKNNEANYSDVNPLCNKKDDNWILQLYFWKSLISKILIQQNTKILIKATFAAES
jgi:hypothetical protein